MLKEEAKRLNAVSIMYQMSSSAGIPVPVVLPALDRRFTSWTGTSLPGTWKRSGTLGRLAASYSSPLMTAG